MDELKFIRNIKLYIALWENNATNLKRVTVLECIENGADVNTKFINNANNTPLHLAVSKGEKEIVNILLQHGAKTDVTNDAGKTALDLAKELPECSDIVTILEAHENLESGKKLIVPVAVNEVYTPIKKCEYKKRAGTANVRGQLYETKILTIIYLRALRCKKIKEFYLGTNVDEIGGLDDVCMRIKNGRQDCIIFLQAKYRHDTMKGRIGVQDLWKSSGDFSLLKYFDSYMKIREKINPDTDDQLFRGRYEDMKCYFVIYTTAKDDVRDTRKKYAADDDVTDLIGTGDNQNIFKFISEEQYVESLTNVKLTERVRQMGRKLIKFIRDGKYEMMLTDENIRSFHVVLSQKVLKVTEVNAEGHRTGSFREDFFSADDYFVIILRETLYAEVVKSNKLTTEEIEACIHRISLEPTAETISELIGSVLMYDSNTSTLKILDEAIERSFMYEIELEAVQVAQSEINEAFEIAGRRKLEQMTFKLPGAFGNFDMTINKKKADKRLEHLANKLVDVIHKSTDADGNVVIREGSFASDKRSELGILSINGGIAGAVGNLLIADDENKLMFNLNVNSLTENAQKFYVKLNEKLGDLSKYRFIVEIEDFPRLSLRATEYEKSFARDFLKNLYFYTCQAKEDHLEEIATKELQTHEFNTDFTKSESRMKSNAAFLKIHNEIQKWWMLDQTAHYLTRDMDIFNKIFSDLKNKGLLPFLNFVYLNEMDNVGLEFKEEAVDVLSACAKDKHEAGVVVVLSHACILTSHKLRQLIKAEENYIFIDIDYISRVSPNCLDVIATELSEINTSYVIIVSEDVSRAKNEIEDMIHRCRNKKIILVTSNHAQNEQYTFIIDDKMDLVNLTDTSQDKILKSDFFYQGIKVTFAEVFADARYLINGHMLKKIINNEKIALGPSLETSTYEEIKHYYVPRVLERNILTCYITDYSDDNIDVSSCSSSEDRPLKIRQRFSPSTLIDHYDMLDSIRSSETLDVVLLLDAPGMGKSTLLTHLSLETKRRHPKIWIQRINLIDHTKQFNEWHENGTEVDIIEALKFVSKVVLMKETFRGHKSNPISEINFQIIDGELKYEDCKIDNPLESFELNTFLDCFKKENVIFLFDGFDEVSPHYTGEVTQLLKSITRRNPMNATFENTVERELAGRCAWITSRPYNDLKDILETEFGESFTLMPFSYHDIHVFVDKYMRRNVNLGSLNPEQLKNVDGLFEYMKRFDLRVNVQTKYDINITNVQLHGIYIAAVEYFKTEVKRINLPNKEYVKKWDFQEDILIVWKLFNGDKEYTKSITLSGVPLNVYIAVNYLQSQIKDTRLTDPEQRSRQWDLNTNTFAFYERFLEMKLKNIRFEEKIKMDVHIPDVKLTYDREMKEFREKHKKLAFYTVFEKDALSDDEFNEIEIIMKSMEVGEDKAGLVDRIVNGVPKFVHYTFAEYFAVEHIFDVLKSGEPDKQQRMLDFILNDMVLYRKKGFRVMFDLKLKCTSGLGIAINNDFVNQHIFHILVQQSRETEQRKFSTQQFVTVLDLLVQDKLLHFAEFLLDAMTNVIDKTNADHFIFIIQESIFLNNLIDLKNKKLVNKVMNCILSVEPTKFYSVLGYLWTKSTPSFLK